MKENNVKQSPIAGLSGYGGGAGSVIFGRKGVGGYQIERSLRFNGGDQTYLNRTPSTSGNRRTFTFACWIKRTKLVNCGSSGQEIFRAGDSALSAMNFAPSDGPCDALSFKADQGGVSPGSATDAVFRDFSAWFHVVYRIDTTQSTASNRVRVYVNGVEQTWHTTNYPSQNQELKFNQSGQPHYIGGTEYLEGYLADIHFIDGQSLDPSNFGETNDDGIWDPKKYTGSFGTNGFHLKFDDVSSDAALGTDSSGNGNTWTVNNISATGATSPTATVVGDPTAQTDNPFGSGQGYSIDFDGNDEIRFTGPGTVTGDLTIECFYKMSPSASGYQRIFSTKEDVYSSQQTIIRRHTNGNLQFYFGNGTPEQQSGSISASTWRHAAIVYDRSAGTVSYYDHGSRAGTDSYSSDVPITLMVAGGGYGSENFQGSISNCRITKQVLYSGSSYTVPTSTLTTTSQGATASNVTLLCCHQNSTTAVQGTIGSPSDIDSLFDSPTDGTQSDTGAGGEVSGNYCTFNGLRNGATLSNGNLDVSSSSDGVNSFGTFGVSSGKWYWEVTIISKVNFHYPGIGVNTDLSQPVNQQSGGANDPDGYMYLASAQTFNNDDTSSYGASYDAGDVIGVALDMDAGTITFYKNGVSQGQAFSGISGTAVPVVISFTGSACSANWGQRAFAYSAPSNHKALCTTNLPTPTIADGSKYFEAKTYTGNGSTQAITGLNFSPDAVWIKSRSFGYDHALFDPLRGALKRLRPNQTNAEGTDSTTLTSFNSDGFTTGSDDVTNKNNDAYIAWAWDAGADSSKTYTVKVVSDSGNKYRFDDFGTSAVTLDLAEGSTYIFDQSDSSNSGHPLRFSTTSNGTHGGGSEYTTGVTVTGTPGQAGAKTTIVVAASAPTLYYYCTQHSGMGGQANTNSTAGASNFDGGIQATIKANQTAGFSMGKFTGTGSVNTVGTGLSNTKMLILKNRDSSSNWVFYHTLVDGSYDYMYLNLTTANASSGLTHTMNNTFKVGTNTDTNASGADYLFMAFSPVADYSEFGSYTGNGSSDGPFVYTGFRPALIITKRTDSTGGWVLWDTARNPSNVATKELYPDDPSVEYTGGGIDILSNGFKLRNSSAHENNNNASYIYVAFAENPFKTARAR